MLFIFSLVLYGGLIFLLFNVCLCHCNLIYINKSCFLSFQNNSIFVCVEGSLTSLSSKKYVITFQTFLFQRMTKQLFCSFLEWILVRKNNNIQQHISQIWGKFCLSLWLKLSIFWEKRTIKSATKLYRCCSVLGRGLCWSLSHLETLFRLLMGGHHGIPLYIGPCCSKPARLVFLLVD